MSAYSGTGRLLRLALRRDRIQLPVWGLAAAALMAAGAAAVADEFPTVASRVTGLRGAGTNGAVLLMRGTPVGTDLGAMVNFRNFSSLLVAVGLMSTFAIVRHTRQSEENGRAELVGAGAVGRHAQLTAALVLALAANLLFGGLVSATLLGTDLPVDGSLAMGAACVVTGMAFAGLAAVSAQLFQSSRAANSLAATAVGVAFLVRGVGDALGAKAADGIQVISAWPAWLSPIGWGTQVRPFGDERWWVLALPVAFLVACVGIAFFLVARRDLGAGLIPDRPGPATAARTLLSPLGLAWRLHRGTTIGWVIGGVLFGLGIGTLGAPLDEALAGNDGVTKLLGQLAGADVPSLVEVFFAAMMNVFGVLAAGFAVQILLRLRAEESGGQAEALLSAAVGRFRWVASHLAIAVGGAAAMLALSGFGAGLADASVGGGTGVLTLVGAGLAQLPATLVMAGFAVLVFGGLPRLAVALTWAGLAAGIVTGLLGDVLGLPQSVRDLSPFSHVPAVPAVDAAAGPILGLTAVAAALAAAGVMLFRRRDLTA